MLRMCSFIASASARALTNSSTSTLRNQSGNWSALGHPPCYAPCWPCPTHTVQAHCVN